MKELIAILLLGMLFHSCNFSNRSEGSKSNYSIEIFPNDSISGYKIVDGRVLSFKFNVDSTASLLKSIIVYSNRTPTQIIEANKSIEKKDFQLVDWNFDSYKDVSVLFSCGTGGCAYWIWNYSPDENKYFYNDDLSEKLGLEIDTISKHIIFHYRAGWMEETWDSLNYINNKLTFVKGLRVERWTDGKTMNKWEKNIRTRSENNKLFTEIDSSIILE